MTFTRALSTNNYGPAKFIVDGTTVANGTHSTIQAAITAASSGDTIFIRPGTYTEDLTLKSGVSLCGYSVNALAVTPNVIIKGKGTLTSGTVSMSGVALRTNSDYCLDLSGVSTLNLINCQILAVTANTAINVSSATINLYSCIGQDGGAGCRFFAGAAGSIFLYNCAFIGTSTTASTFATTSGLTLSNSQLTTPISTSDTAQLVFKNSQIGGSALAAVAITANGTGSSNFAYDCVIQSNNQSAISVGTGATFTLSNCTIGSNAANAITGAGTISYADISFVGSSSTINTTTQTLLVASDFQRVVVQTFTSGTPTYTPTAGMKYCTIEVVGGGGAGGGAAATSSTQGAAGGGGGGGGYARKTVTAATIGTSQTVTVGAGGTVGAAGNNAGNTGGTSSVGSIVSATGGSGGSGSAVSGATNVAFAAGGAGGVGSSGDFNAKGNAGTGGYAVGVTPTCALPGSGGGSYFGGGAAAVGAGTNSTSNGNAGQTYGGGGSGGYNLLSEASGATGAAGGSGVVIITEYV